MKMKKTYAAALAAAMVLTASFSAQAADLNFKAEGESYEDNHVQIEGTIPAADVAASLEGQNLYDLNDVYANTITTNNGATLNGGTTMNGGATVNGGLKTDEIGTATGDSLNINAGETYVNGNETVSGKLTVNSGADINGGATISGDTTVNGMITSTVGADITGTTNLHGDTYVDGTMTVDKVVTNSGAILNGGATVNGGLKTDEIDTATGDSLNINAGHTYVNGDETVGGKLTVNSGADINGGATVNGGASINGGLTVDGTDVMGSIADNADKIAQNTTAIANNSSRINALDRKVSDLGGEIDNVGAISSALAGLHPLDYDGTGSKFQLAAAMGSYDGTQAAAIGGFYHFNEDIMMSVGGATSFGGDNKSAFNVGLSFRVGQGSSGKRVSNDEVLAQLTAMNDKIAALEAENQQLSEKVAALEGGEGAEAAEAE